MHGAQLMNFAELHLLQWQWGSSAQQIQKNLHRTMVFCSWSSKILNGKLGVKVECHFSPLEYFVFSH